MGELNCFVNERGEISLPLEILNEFGLKPGSQIRVEQTSTHLRLYRSMSQLRKVYIEPTNLCNLNCTMCIRNNWDESMGRMTPSTFERFIDGISKLNPLPTVTFGGQGEPLLHSKTIEWVKKIKQLGARVELITNGTLLTKKCSQQLINIGLDVLWVSIDGAYPESYADVRLGAKLSKVLRNLSTFSALRGNQNLLQPIIGIAFVAMKRNINDLPMIIKIGREYGASLFSISNVIPYTAEMQNEQLYTQVLKNKPKSSSPLTPRITIPRIDMNDVSWDALSKIFKSNYNVNFAGNDLFGGSDICKFINDGSTSVAWDGGVSPCWPLMHNYTSYLHGKIHRSRRYVVDNINKTNLLDIWEDPNYVEYRRKVQSFSFAPCSYCNGCQFSETNEEDCLGNGFPTCGCCIWSQGVIQCP